MIQINPAYLAAMEQAKRIADRALSRSKIGVVTESGRRDDAEYTALDIDNFVLAKGTHVVKYVFGIEHRPVAIGRLPVLSERYNYICRYCQKRFIIAPIRKCPYCLTISGFGELMK